MSFHAILVDVVQMPSFGTTQCKRNHGRGRLVAASHCPDRPIWFEARPRAVRDLDSQLVCVRGTSQDVTEQQRAIRGVVESRDFFQGTLDSLTAHVAVLDERGDIIMTNRAWNAFASANDATPTAIGANYLEVCDAAKDDQLASLAGAGLRAIIAGSRTDFRIEYPCHSPTVERWFVLRAARRDGPGDVRVVVAHADITTRHQADAEVATWEGTVTGRHENGGHFIASVAMTPERSQDGMSIGFLTTSSDIVKDVRLTVELDRTPAYAHSALESVPDAMVIVNDPDEIELADTKAAILLGDSHEGAGRSPVEMLIADRYLDRHPGLRIGFFSESPTDPSGAGLRRSVQDSPPSDV
jgi:PAS domain-containing protein